MRAEEVSVLQREPIQQGFLFLQVLAEGGLRKRAASHILIQGTARFCVHRSGENQKGLGRIQKLRRRFRVFQPILRPGRAKDDIQPVVKAGSLKAQQLVSGFFGRIILVHQRQRFVQSAFHADIHFVDPKLPQAAELRIRFAADIEDRGVHGYGLHLWELCVDRFGNLCQPVRRQHKGVAVFQKHPRRVSIEASCLVNIRLHLLSGTDAERHIPVHGAERALVVAAAHSHLQQQRACLKWRAVGGSCVMHKVSSRYFLERMRR